MLSLDTAGPSRIFYCLRCGQTFARLVGEGQFLAFEGLCESCPPMVNTVPGSVYLRTNCGYYEFHEKLNALLPLAAWQREVELHCRWAEAEG